MSQEYRVTIDPDGNMHLIDSDGDRLSPLESRRIGQGIYSAASKSIHVYVASRKSNKGDWIEYKIGMTNDLERRAKEIFRGYVNPRMHYHFPCDEWGCWSAREVEKTLHTIFKFAGVHITGEWFRLHDLDIALIKKWFGEKGKALPSPAVLDMLEECAIRSLEYQKKSDAHWITWMMRCLLNEMPGECWEHSYGSVLASVMGYRRIVECFPRHYSQEKLTLYNQVWQTSLEAIIKYGHDQWLSNRKTPWFKKLMEVVFVDDVTID